MAVQIQLRGDTSANWVSHNTVLAAREVGIETDTWRLKVGNGSSGWNSLSYTMNTILSGSSNPTTGTGVNGDFFVNTSTMTFFGPKTSGAWGSGTSISGGSISTTSNTVTINFGSAPGTNMVVQTITGQTAVTVDTIPRAFLIAKASSNHNAYEHAIVPIRLVCGNIVAGVGFDIIASSDWRLTGQWNVGWIYN